ncbi:hypothetical protein Bca52824_064321 [Brassica carinata]|uniref:At2g35280-like TPR domain-containing protein n=1 Tax=Brassica carinata TaxID=52824 RepID=A0A8X7UB92_BRACI|nr:hypothetical protein Bca52824_064321 [Brassica carinata]
MYLYSFYCKTDSSFGPIYLQGYRSLADDEDVYASFDLFKYPWRLNGFRLRYLLRRCYAQENPSTLYIKGVEYFYRRNMYVEGLDLMKRAADAGFERASYTYAMTSKLWDDDGDHFRGFSRDYVAKIRLLGHWALWDIENRKAEDMCNRCFWIKEVGLFLRDFKASTGHPNFEAWR